MNGRRYFATLLALVGWFGLIAQAWLVQHNNAVSSPERWIQFFTYFTITTNILVAVYATVLAVTPPARQGGFFFRPSVQTAITMDILIVGIIFNTVLRFLWVFVGLQAVVHELLHTVTPLLALIYWIAWVNARNVRYRAIPAWLLYPAIYTFVVMLRGNSSGWYPYPFVDVVKFGYRQVMINSLFVLLAFVIIALILVFTGQRKATLRASASIKYR